jgi:dUTPase
MINLSSKPILLRKGDMIGQGIIHEFLVTSDDTAYQRAETRLGGFGSTDA